MPNASIDRLNPSEVAWLGLLRGAVREAVRLRVILNAQGVGMISQVLMQGLVL